MSGSEIFSYIVIYTCVWWVLFYISLPIGIKFSAKKELGHADSAPAKSWLKLKFIIVSIISFIFSYIIQHYLS